MQIKYLDKVEWNPGSKFYIVDENSRSIPIWFKNIENAIKTSNKREYIGYFIICIFNENNFSFRLPKGKYSYKQAIDLRRYANTRMIYIASDLSQVYADSFEISTSDRSSCTFDIDYDYVFGDRNCFPIGTKVESSLPVWDGKKITLDLFGYDVLSTIKDPNSLPKDQIMSMPYYDQLRLLYSDRNAYISYPEGLEDDYFNEILPLATLREVKEG